tara:strand:+ start:256 stop:843 length:588 start_codon:yes stop_codon:yes gene_type:complete
MGIAKAMIALIWFIEQVEFGVLPIESSRIHHHTADSGTMSAQPFCQAVHHDIGTIFDRPQQERGSKGGVNDERNLFFMDNPGIFTDIGNLKCGISDGFDINRSCLFINGQGKPLKAIDGDHPGMDSKLRQNVVEHCKDATVQITCRDNFISGPGQIDNGIENRTGPRSQGKCSPAPSMVATRSSRIACVGFMIRV